MRQSFSSFFFVDARIGPGVLGTIVPYEFLASFHLLSCHQHQKQWSWPQLPVRISHSINKHPLDLHIWLLFWWWWWVEIAANISKLSRSHKKFIVSNPAKSNHRIVVDPEPIITGQKHLTCIRRNNSIFFDISSCQNTITFMTHHFDLEFGPRLVLDCVMNCTSFTLPDNCQVWGLDRHLSQSPTPQSEVTVSVLLGYDSLQVVMARFQRNFLQSPPIVFLFFLEEFATNKLNIVSDIWNECQVMLSSWSSIFAASQTNILLVVSAVIKLRHTTFLT